MLNLVKIYKKMRQQLFYLKKCKLLDVPRGNINY